VTIFKRIIDGDEPCSLVYRDDSVMAFMDLHPISRGHTLVIPIEEYEDIFATPSVLLGALICKTKMISDAVRKAFLADGIEILQFNGAAAGQTVFHIHFHIVPRWNGLASLQHGKAPRQERAQLDEDAYRIKTHLTKQFS